MKRVRKSKLMAGSLPAICARREWPRSHTVKQRDELVRLIAYHDRRRQPQ
jgi:hypothetical protein